MKTEKPDEEHVKLIEPYGPYIREIANKLNLEAWRFNLIHDPAPEECLARMRCIEGKKLFEVELGKSFFQEDAEGQRETIVHEVIHVHFGDMHNGLGKVLSKDSWKWYELAMEHGIDALARIIAPFMPLPPKSCLIQNESAA